MPLVLSTKYVHVSCVSAEKQAIMSDMDEGFIKGIRPYATVEAGKHVCIPSNGGFRVTETNRSESWEEKLCGLGVSGDKWESSE